MNTTISNGGVELALTMTDDHGADKPNLLFVHGLGSAQVLWDRFVDALSDRYRCWNLDLRGHGASDRAPRAYQPQDYASDVAAALDHIGHPTIGVGHSLGGGCLVSVGAAGHEHLAAAYALDPNLFPGRSAPTAMASIFAKQLAMLRQFQPEGRPVDDYEAVLGAAPYVGGGTNHDAMVPQQLRGRAESLSMLDPECLHQLITSDKPNVPNPAPALAIPLRVVAADPTLGAVFRPEHADLLRQSTPSAEVETFAGVGHQLMMIRGFDDKVSADLAGWLARLE